MIFALHLAIMQDTHAGKYMYHLGTTGYLLGTALQFGGAGVLYVTSSSLHM